MDFATDRCIPFRGILALFRHRMQKQKGGTCDDRRLVAQLVDGIATFCRAWKQGQDRTSKAFCHMIRREHCRLRDTILANVGAKKSRNNLGGEYQCLKSILRQGIVSLLVPAFGD